MAAHCRADEPKIFRAAASCADHASGSDGAGRGVLRCEPAAQEDLLLVALPGGDGVGIPVEAGAETVWAYADSSALAGCGAAQPEVCTDGVLPVHRGDYVGGG